MKNKRTVVTYTDAFGNTYTGLPGRFTTKESAERKARRLPRRLGAVVEYFHRGQRLDYHIIIK